MRRHRIVAGLLALFMGALGVHYFYLGQPRLGLLYLVLAVTGISFFLGLFDALIFLTMSDAEFQRSFGRGRARSAIGVRRERRRRRLEAELELPDWQTRRPRRLADRERFALEAARAQNGLITPNQLALMTRMSRREAEEVLTRLADEGACEMDITAVGEIRYFFPDLHRSRLTGDGSERVSTRLSGH